MQKHTALWIGLGLLGSSACAYYLSPMWGCRISMGTICLSNLKTISVAALTYSTDNDDHLPTTTLWGDEVKAYAPHADCQFRYPSLTAPNGYGYGMNDNYSHKALPHIKQPETAILFFDSADLSWNAHSPGPNYPVPSRHDGKGTVGYADGHVRMVKA